MIAGLGEEYESFIQNVMTQKNEVTYAELEAMMTDIEMLRAAAAPSVGLNVNVASSGNAGNFSKNDIKPIP